MGVPALGATAGLSPRQKAAVIVRLVLAEGGDIDLARLPPELQTELAQEMALMGVVDRETRNAIVSEFCDRLEAISLSFPGDIDGTLNLLDGHLSPDTTDELRRLAALNGAGDPWDSIAAMAPGLLAELARTEAIEIAAVMFSKLPVPRAAEVFGLLEKERARQIAYAMSLTGGIGTEALRRIGRALIQAAAAVPQPPLEGKAGEKVGAILNFSPSGMRDSVLAGLDDDDAVFAGEVRKTIFTWAHIPRRIDARDIPRIMREVDNPVLLKALAGARGPSRETVDFLLGGISPRLAESMREEMEGLGKVSTRDAEEAMDQVVITIRRMEAAGDLFLIAQEPEEEEAETESPTG
ncbi:flagellar motor switch protein FliG [Paracoccus denitrificans]|jgi:flagellar motor switch protein FliG|uniref:Flagellar motor switch protein FliG n=1 Tax=Paracoccus denitrificans (strain Pd 1222) TaxID=318586 RepID=A1BAI4_PARDP|nr:FliG C-terminal domain-containing protein [Paracoccus denitrificans]ABL72528.1 flagellar motor switch protein FliG [Paracoccus denitrificans PD1222]MBB4626520.1 flagellar motor switch protein FliG [Paracoccus denitrificans]MCU7428838.1 flagellar motor switch protein FliG [Paracoccus denitrificans]QAR29072.1 flagellar motor switch protein FliG [Paracoccus denitrificans]UPV97233.1 flagellar motor switch protein FliG [Paracoccus denitrificans]